MKVKEECENVGLKLNIQKTKITTSSPITSCGASGKEPDCQCKRHKRRGFDPRVSKIPWRRAWQPTPVSLLENPMDREAWRATVQGVTKTQAQLKRLSTCMHTRGFGNTHPCLCWLPWYFILSLWSRKGPKERGAKRNCLKLEISGKLRQWKWKCLYFFLEYLFSCISET